MIIQEIQKNNALSPKNFTVIIPVRNGGEYIKQSVNSILNQTLQDFNIIVLDNASTDNTVEWLRSLNDPRITIYLSEKPLSIEENWGRIRQVPRNRWMVILGHDDIMFPNYLEVMNHLIQRHPAASLYQPHFNIIDDKGKVVGECKPMAEKQSAADFFRETLENGGGFMMRSEDYDRVGGIPPYPNLFFADFTLWIELSRISYKATASETCFSYRVHSANTSATSADEKYLAGFELFVHYLYSLKTEDDEFRDVINKYSKDIIALYCKYISHRLLRTDVEKRNNLTVSTIITKFKGYADLLIDNNRYNPLMTPSIFIAKFIDSTSITRKFFLWFKRIYSKPIL